MAARLTAKFGPRMPIITGQLLMATGLVALCLPRASEPAWLLVLLMIPVGTGGGFAVPVVTALILDRVPAQRAGTASGVLNASRQLGGALSVAVFGALVFYYAHFLHGLRTSLLIAALLVVLIAAASVLLKRRPPDSTSATSAWTSQKLDSIEHAEELEIASLRPSGELGSRRIIWVVRVGDAIYVCSVHGPGSDWCRGTPRPRGKPHPGRRGRQRRHDHRRRRRNRRRRGHRSPDQVPALRRVHHQGHRQPEASSTTMRLEPR